MPCHIPATLELIGMFEDSTGHRPELLHWKGVTVVLSRDVSAALGYAYDAAPARIVRRVGAARRSQYLLYLDGAERRAFFQHASPGMACRARGAGRLTLLTASGLFEAACDAPTPAGRTFRTWIEETAARTGFGSRALGLLTEYGIEGTVALPEQDPKPPRLTLLPGGAG